MELLWLWVLLAAVLGGLGLTAWGLWWLWHKAAAVGTELEHLLGRLEEAGEIIEKLDMEPLEQGTDRP